MTIGINTCPLKARPFDTCCAGNIRLRHTSADDIF